mmetsp:Transcript_18055/g.63861  ORF Transcript_18055/g.63861 Transcript_18055/m.63861 type:complete len:258 (-) Transcript_18055:54-827(-)
MSSPDSSLAPAPPAPPSAAEPPSPSFSSFFSSFGSVDDASSVVPSVRPISTSDFWYESDLTSCVPMYSLSTRGCSCTMSDTCASTSPTRSVSRTLKKWLLPFVGEPRAELSSFSLKPLPVERRGRCDGARPTDSTSAASRMAEIIVTPRDTSIAARCWSPGVSDFSSRAPAPMASMQRATASRRRSPIKPATLACSLCCSEMRNATALSAVRGADAWNTTFHTMSMPARSRSSTSNAPSAPLSSSRMAPPRWLANRK